MNFYNENNPKAAAWLRQLARDGHIPPGVVDERSIAEIQPGDLSGFTQCHFFAGIGGWSLALRIAGWPENRPVWTGGCPCQPFSVAGKRKGEADERHLWPHFRRLIAEWCPPAIFGEQVESKAGRLWFSRVRVDLEALGHAVGCADLCGPCVSAPHIRPRLYWVSDSEGERTWGLSTRRARSNQQAPDIERCREDARLDDTSGDGRQSGRGDYRSHERIVTAADGEIGFGMVNADGYHSQWWSGPLQMGRNCLEGEVTRGGRKYRAQWRVKPGLSLLAHGVPGRVDQICGFGNAIIPQVAAEFIAAYVEAK